MLEDNFAVSYQAKFSLTTQPAMGMNKQTMAQWSVYNKVYNGILFSTQQQQATNSCNNTDEFH